MTRDSGWLPFLQENTLTILEMPGSDSIYLVFGSIDPHKVSALIITHVLTQY